MQASLDNASTSPFDPVNGTSGFTSFHMYGNDINTVEGGFMDVFDSANVDITLGVFGFLTTGGHRSLGDHMEGHHDQSQFFGPFYLPVVGFVSVGSFFFGNHKTNPVELQAENLGGQQHSLMNPNN